MPLTMRPTGLGSGADKDRPDYTVYSGGWAVGRIYETRGGPDNLRWFWSMTITGSMTRSDRVATLEEAKVQLRKSWDAWKVWAKLEEVDELRRWAVRRYTCADGSFEWYVLSHTRRRASKIFPTRAAAAAERAKLQMKLDLAKEQVLRRTPKGSA